MMNIESLKKLWVHELKDLWSAENQLLDTLPRTIDSATDDELRSTLETLRDETKGQIGRIETVFRGLDFSPRGHKCRGMEGLIEELKDALGPDIDDEVRDAAIVAAMQRIEHYQIAGYGTARSFAEKLGQHDAADHLQASLDEEADANRAMTRSAERSLNFVAMMATA